jgi:hypothetical protein
MPAYRGIDVLNIVSDRRVLANALEMFNSLTVRCRPLHWCRWS